MTFYINILRTPVHCDCTVLCSRTHQSLYQRSTICVVRFLFFFKYARISAYYVSAFTCMYCIK